jgi:DNA repair protein RadC
MNNHENKKHTLRDEVKQNGFDENIASNHRDRMRQRFAKTGFEGFLDYEILEYLLFFIFRQGDTKPRAKALLKKFGSFSNILDASIEELAKVEGMGESSALGLKAIRGAITQYFKDSALYFPNKLTTATAYADYARAIIGDKQNEVLLAIFLNNKKEIIESKIINEGNTNESVFISRKIAENALKNASVSVIMIHNHLSGSCKPSENEIKTTHEIRSSLGLININFIEHLIISGKDYFSFAKNGYL